MTSTDHKSIKQNKVFGCTTIVASLLIGCLIALVVIIFNHHLPNKASKHSAVDSISNITIEIINTIHTGNMDIDDYDSINTTSGTYNFNDEQLDTLHSSFAAFDDNNDDMWSYDDCKDYMAYRIEENNLDVNNDGIISFKEIIYDLMVLNQSNSTLIQNYLNKVLIPAAINKYSLEHLLDGSDIIKQGINFNIFEYVAAMILNLYDEESNGYVIYDNYLSIKTTNVFNYLDINNNGLVTFDEFINQTYSLSGLTWVHLLNNGMNITIDSSSDSYIDNQLSINKYNNYSINLYQCPHASLNNESLILQRYYGYNSNQGYDRRRRRLQSRNTVQAFLQVYVSCRRCPSDSGLYDDVSDR